MASGQQLMKESSLVTLLLLLCDRVINPRLLINRSGSPFFFSVSYRKRSFPKRKGRRAEMKPCDTNVSDLASWLFSHDGVDLLTGGCQGVSPRSGQESQMEINPWMESGTFLVLSFGLPDVHLALLNLESGILPPHAPWHHVFS